MPHYEARLSSKGQLTIPSEVRALLQLKEGDRVDFYVEPNSTNVRLLARNKTLTDLRGIVRAPSRKKISTTSKDIRDAVGQHVAEKHERISREWNERHEFEEWRRAKSIKAAE